MKKLNKFEIIKEYFNLIWENDYCYTKNENELLNLLLKDYYNPNLHGLFHSGDVCKGKWDFDKLVKKYINECIKVIE